MFALSVATQPGSYTPPFGVSGTTFRGNDAILAWEDLVTSSSDHDYQDLVVLLRDITPANVPAVPLPAAAWLLLSGLGAAVPALRRRRTQAIDAV